MSFTDAAEKTSSGKWECSHCTFLNPVGTRICGVCCRTGNVAAEEDTNETQGDNGDCGSVIKSNLIFSIKDDQRPGSDSVGVITKEVDSSTSSVRNDVDKNYEDVSNMLKRMRIRREELVERRGAAAEKAHVQPIDVDDADEEEEEEGYIEMTETATSKQPLYERVRFPRQTPTTLPTLPTPPTPVTAAAGTFSHSDSIDSVSDVEYRPVWSKSYRH